MIRISSQGHKEMEGNLLQLLKLLSNFCPNMKMSMSERSIYLWLK